MIQGVTSKFKFEDEDEDRQQQKSPSTTKTPGKTAFQDTFEMSSPGNGAETKREFIGKTQMEEIAKLELEVISLKRKINQLNEENKKKEGKYTLDKEELKKELEKAKEVSLYLILKEKDDKEKTIQELEGKLEESCKYKEQLQQQLDSLITQKKQVLYAT